MQDLRRSRRIVRLAAAWLMLWFAAMAAAPFVGLADATRACAAHGGQESHEGHEGHEGHACGDADGSDLHAGHAGSASAGFTHCPVCLHAAAPPPVHALQALPEVLPAGPAAQPASAPVRVRTAVPPPARGPPAFS